eukprot:4169103-Alexandrium_andersonii.AAC.1
MPRASWRSSGTSRGGGPRHSWPRSLTKAGGKSASLRQMGMRSARRRSRRAARRASQGPCVGLRRGPPPWRARPLAAGG